MKLLDKLFDRLLAVDKDPRCRDCKMFRKWTGCSYPNHRACDNFTRRRW